MTNPETSANRIIDTAEIAALSCPELAKLCEAIRAGQPFEHDHLAKLVCLIFKIAYVQGRRDQIGKP